MVRPLWAAPTPGDEDRWRLQRPRCGVTASPGVAPVQRARGTRAVAAGGTAVQLRGSGWLMGLQTKWSQSQLFL